MHKLPLALLCAPLLTSCHALTRSTAHFGLPVPPQALTEPCVPTPRHRQPNGAASSADDEQTIVDGRNDLKACDDKRKLALDAWPKAPTKNKGN